MIWVWKNYEHHIIQASWPVFRVGNLFTAFFWLIPVWVSDSFYQNAEIALKGESPSGGQKKRLDTKNHKGSLLAS